MLLFLLLDLQEIGYYLQYSILQLNFHTDAFGQLKTGEGRAVDGNSAATWFMDAWTIFYIGWWVSWSAFVGLFIARISKGRTIRSIVVFSYCCPLLYIIVWFGVFGGTGFRQARQATEIQELGLSLFNNSDYYQSSVSSVCYDVPQVAEMAYVTADGAAKTFTNTLMGITPVCVLDTSDDQTAWFNVLNSFSYPDDFENGFGPFLTWVSIFSVSVYFVTSSDSGSLIVDHLASNGFEEAHWLQRVFWAFTEGAVVSICATSRNERTCARLWLGLTA
jgi:choline-glycine betaine transporter